MEKDTKTNQTNDERVGAKLVTEFAAKQLTDTYKPNGLPPVDTSEYTEELTESLQKRALQLQD